MDFFGGAEAEFGADGGFFSVFEAGSNLGGYIFVENADSAVGVLSYLGRLISPGSPRRRKGSRALKKRKGVWGSQGEKDKLFFPTSLCGSQYNNVACSRTCFSFLRTF